MSEIPKPQTQIEHAGSQARAETEFEKARVEAKMEVDRLIAEVEAKPESRELAQKLRRAFELYVRLSQGLDSTGLAS